MMHMIDWLPTLLHAAGADQETFPELADLDGVDQVTTYAFPPFLFKKLLFLIYSTTPSLPTRRR